MPSNSTKLLSSNKKSLQLIKHIPRNEIGLSHDYGQNEKNLAAAKKSSYMQIHALHRKCYEIRQITEVHINIQTAIRSSPRSLNEDYALNKANDQLKPLLQCKKD